MWQIDKRIDFCYGHRVWSQDLKQDYCAGGDTKMKCRHLHGHEGSVHVFLESDELDKGFVTDFKHLGWLQDFLDEFVDHKFLVDIADPAFIQIVGGKVGTADVLETKGDWNQIVARPALFFENQQLELTPLELYPNAFTVTDTNLTGVTKELLEGFLIVDFVPTSENLAKWIYDIVDRKMKDLGVKTARIEWFETPKSRSTYIGNK